MGVSGSGKTTIGSALAAELGWEFADGDDLHPKANVEKMARGVPLDDADRMPWLQAVHDLILSMQENGQSPARRLSRITGVCSMRERTSVGFICMDPRH